MSDSITIKDRYWARVVPQYCAVFPKPWKWATLPGLGTNGLYLRYASGLCVRTNVASEGYWRKEGIWLRSERRPA